MRAVSRFGQGKFMNERGDEEATYFVMQHSPTQSMNLVDEKERVIVHTRNSAP
jgi:hypothetical protein